jgi:hypothetical protein
MFPTFVACKYSTTIRSVFAGFERPRRRLRGPAEYVHSTLEADQCADPRKGRRSRVRCSFVLFKPGVGTGVGSASNVSTAQDRESTATLAGALRAHSDDLSVATSRVQGVSNERRSARLSNEYCAHYSLGAGGHGLPTRNYVGDKYVGGCEDGGVCGPPFAGNLAQAISEGLTYDF